jgi:glycosyltransferase involved in cell wall biosynthesis
MRITIVLGPFLPVPPVLGGAVEKAQLHLADAYRAAGHDVTILSRQYPGFVDAEVIDGIRHLRVASFGRMPSLWKNLIRDFVYALRVARALPSSDITVTNSFFLPLTLPRRRAGKIYVHVARYPKGQMWLYFRADRLQALSRAVGDAIVKQVPAFAPKVVSIGYPVPDAYFVPQSGVRRDKVVLYVGRIAFEKGVHVLLEAFNLLRRDGNLTDLANWKVRIVGPHEVLQGGDGQAYLDSLKALARPLGAGCEFAGPIFDTRALIAEYQAASIFVYPSIAETGEALGLSAMEAMSAGCAVIVSSLECFDDFVRNDVNSLKFDHRAEKPEAMLAAKLAELIGEPKRLDDIVQHGRETARGFRVAAVAGRMLDDFCALHHDA